VKACGLVPDPRALVGLVAVPKLPLQTPLLADQRNWPLVESPFGFADPFSVAPAVPIAVAAFVVADVGAPPLAPHEENLNEPILVCQFQFPLLVRYSVVYQKVQSSAGSICMLE
jgi:hypothetical protein